MLREKLILWKGSRGTLTSCFVNSQIKSNGQYVNFTLGRSLACFDSYFVYMKLA